MQTRVEKTPSTAKRMIIMLILVGLLLLALVGWNVGGKMAMKQAMANMSQPPQTVSTTTVEYQFWQPLQGAVGTLRAVRGADLAFEVGGLVTKVNLASGGEVKEGDLLVQLRDTEDLAMLRQLEAAATLSELSYSRAERMIDKQTISRADYDTTKADLDARRAAVQQQKAVIARKQLRAPFAGRSGIVTISPGAYVSPGNALVTLQQLDWLYVDFAVPQRHLGRLAGGPRVNLTLDAFPGQSFSGELTAIEPKVDGDTRNARVEAKVDNADGRLSPGMFANVEVEVGEPKRRLTLPQSAVAFNPYGETVFVVKPGGTEQGKEQPPTAQQVFVTSGGTRGDQIAIETGLEEGTEVVTSGQLKLKNGTPLSINNEVQPASDADPRPQEH